jgi:hypothetical protein
MNHSDGGKGSSPRPFSISNEEYSKRWDAIFGTEEDEEEDEDDEELDTDEDET